MSDELYYVFCYGSNSPRQLAQRLGHGVDAYAAYADGWQRRFAGYSQGWDGAVATMVRKRGSTVYGAVALLTLDDIEGPLDRYEGYPRLYQRYLIDVMCPEVDENDPVTAVVYLHRGDPALQPPSPDYLEAVAETVGTFWSGEDGNPITADDITVRLVK